MSDRDLPDQRALALQRLATLHQLREHARKDTRSELLKSIGDMIEQESMVFRDHLLNRFLTNPSCVRDAAAQRRALTESQRAAAEEKILQREYIDALERERQLWGRVKGLHPGQQGHVPHEWSEWMAAADRLQAFARRLNAQQAHADLRR